MDVGQRRAHIDSLQNILAKKVSEQRAYFEGQLSQLGSYVPKPGAAAVMPRNARNRSRNISRKRTSP
jgi:hypothetical protein